MTLLERQLLLHEGIRLKPYKDSLGIWTVLVGYNIEARGWDFIARTLGRPVGMESEFTRAEALTVLRADLERIEKVVRVTLPEFDSLDPIRQRVILDFSFNLARRALQFKKAIDGVRARNWSKVAREMYASKWARQVDDGEGGRFGRADRLARMILTGEEPNDPEWIRFLSTAA